MLDFIYDKLTISKSLSESRSHFQNPKFNLINTYCRNLFNALKTINNNYPAEDITDEQRKTSKEIIKHSADTIKEIKKYTSLLRSFIPEKMVYVIAINISDVSDSSYDSYRNLVKSYAMLEHISLIAISDKIYKPEWYKKIYKDYEKNNKKKQDLEQELSLDENTFKKLKDEYQKCNKKYFISWRLVLKKFNISSQLFEKYIENDVIKIDELIKYRKDYLNEQNKLKSATCTLKIFEIRLRAFYPCQKYYLEKLNDRDSKQRELNLTINNNKYIKEFTNELQTFIDIILIDALGEAYFESNQDYPKIKKELIEDFRIEFPNIKFMGIEPTQEN